MAAHHYPVKETGDKDKNELETKQLWSTHPFYHNSNLAKVLTSSKTTTGNAFNAKHDVPFDSTARLLKSRYDSDGRKIEIDDRDRANDRDHEWSDPGEYDRLRRDGGEDGKGRTVDEMVKMVELQKVKRAASGEVEISG
ncbi:hypothetical protein LTR86_009585 [Recurvomyces mirabilis]|nr:hypothetical protein LTR86_009585 [Recurvomyces mirabilis]